jgi:hypothetical protein
MASVKDVLATSGSLPLGQLKLRSSQTADQVNLAVRTLKERGLVEILNNGDSLPTNDLAEDNTIRLTPKGLSSLF